jgi:hypothetical protein
MNGIGLDHHEQKPDSEEGGEWPLHVPKHVKNLQAGDVFCGRQHLSHHRS